MEQENWVPQGQWDLIVADVTNRMMAFCRSFMTPLSTSSEVDVKLVGTGTYLGVGSRIFLLTCEHVVRSVPIHYRFRGSDSVFELKDKFRMDRYKHDAALVEFGEKQWRICEHQAEALPYEKFSVNHKLAIPEELLFFYGWSGENANYGFGVHETKETGYCSQQIKKSGNRDYFEIFWDPQKTTIEQALNLKHHAQIRFDDPSGFSGSVVWNTRYCEITNQGRKWSPTDAVVTGLLQRWDQTNKLLMVRKNDQLRGWIDEIIESRGETGSL